MHHINKMFSICRRKQFIGFYYLTSNLLLLVYQSDYQFQQFKVLSPRKYFLRLVAPLIFRNDGGIRFQATIFAIPGCPYIGFWRYYVMSQYLSEKLSSLSLQNSRKKNVREYVSSKEWFKRQYQHEMEL